LADRATRRLAEAANPYGDFIRRAATQAPQKRGGILPRGVALLRHVKERRRKIAHKLSPPRLAKKRGNGPVNLVVWLPAMFVLGLACMGVCLLFVQACDRI